ncbi:MAG: hypothetical protein NT140_05130 [Deltaproteobacteria bacterium]|nr:hypothetical protein [Deltaproteobacteria bacterium]
MKFHGKSFPLASWALFFLFISSLTLTGCGNNSTAYDPQAEYAKACADAAIVTPEKISRNLTAITPDNNDLIWENNVVGLSEFVVHGKKSDGSKISVGIKAVTQTTAYFTS